MVFKAIFHYPGKAETLQLIKDMAEFRCRKVFEVIDSMGLSEKEHTELIKQVIKVNKNT